MNTYKSKSPTPTFQPFLALPWQTVQGPVHPASCLLCQTVAVHVPQGYWPTLQVTYTINWHSHIAHPVVAPGKMQYQTASAPAYQSLEHNSRFFLPVHFLLCFSAVATVFKPYLPIHLHFSIIFFNQYHYQKLECDYL